MHTTIAKPQAIDPLDFLGIARLMRDRSPSSSPPFALAMATLTRDAAGRAALKVAGPVR